MVLVATENGDVGSEMCERGEVTSLDSEGGFTRGDLKAKNQPSEVLRAPQ